MARVRGVMAAAIRFTSGRNAASGLDGENHAPAVIGDIELVLGKTWIKDDDFVAWIENRLQGSRCRRLPSRSS